MNRPHSIPKNSTTVRALSRVPGLLGAVPGVGPELLAQTFLRPGSRVRPLEFLDAAHHFPVFVGGHRIEVGAWGAGPTVLFVHGWGGGAIQFIPLRDRLVRAGYRVVLFDAPGHGGSPGLTTHLGELQRVIEAIVEEFEPLQAMVGHSFGALAASLAHARGVRTEGLVFLAPLPSFDFALDEFQRSARLSTRLRERIARRVEKLAGVGRNEARLERGLGSETPALLVHDVGDRQVPVGVARELAHHHPHVELEITEGLGHQRIASDPGVIERVTAFVQGLPLGAISALERSLVPAPHFD